MNQDRSQPESGAAARAIGCSAACSSLRASYLYVAATGSQSVVDRVEARFALAVKEMSERGDWLVPSNFGEPR